jgi:hypothetical protein
MKTLKVSDRGHEKLTALLGELTARTSKMWTYMDVIDALLERSIKLPTKLIAEVENFAEENEQLGYTTTEEFIRDSVRTSLKRLSEGKTYLEIPKENSDELKRAIKEMKLPFTSTTDFLYNKIRKALREHKK